MLLGYVRCSTLEQSQDGRSTLQDQERVIRGIAMTRGELDPVVYKDPGVSGSIPLNLREGGQKLLEMAQPGDYICAAKLDRMFRSSIDALSTVETLKAKGVGVILADISTEPVSDNGVGALFFKILAAVADFERERIAERVTLGRASKKARHGHIGGDAPYGFVRQGKGVSAMLVNNPDEQDVIHEMTDLWMKCRSYNATAKALNAKGMKAREGDWSAKQVCRILVRIGAAHPPTQRVQVS